MTVIINVYDAKTNLSKYLDQVTQGDEFIIGKYGKPVAKLAPMPQKPRKPGALKGKMWIADDFDEPLPEWMSAIEQKKV